MSDHNLAGAFNDWRRPAGILTVYVQDEEGGGAIYRDLTLEQAERLANDLIESLRHINEPRMSPEEWESMRERLADRHL